MYSVQEVCEEQERQYNRLMQEDNQYCHPESFKWGFEHGFEYALTKLGWHPGSELPTKDGEYIVICEGFEMCPFRATFDTYINDWSHDDVKWWCHSPKN